VIAAGTTKAQRQGGSLTLGTELDIPGLDPVKAGAFDTSSQMAAALIFDTLTGRDKNGDVVPKLALSWSHSDDYKHWTFKLRSGVYFHDGTPFNAVAVAWNTRGIRTQIIVAVAPFSSNLSTKSKRSTI